MELSRVIIGSIVTEKAERIKQNRCYTLKVQPAATKIDVQNALEQYFDVDVTSVRVMRVGSKTRAIGAGREITKRHGFKKMIVTLSEKSKALDLSHFKS